MHVLNLSFWLFLSTLLSIDAKYDEKHSFASLKMRIGDYEDFNLWFIGTYMASHKYFATDSRYMVGDTVQEEDRVFYKKFPSPRLREMDPTVKKYCEQSLDMCISTINKQARKSVILRYITRDTVGQMYAPFSSYYEMFRFRQTAAYYMCWFTQQRKRDLMYTNSNMTCLEYLHVSYEVPKELRKQHMESWTKVIVDERDTTEYINKHPFACAELWFCPDPCYGRKTGGNAPTAVSKPKADPGNPCRNQRNGWCEWQEGTNTNLRDLIRNRFNQTCNCRRQGFEWQPEYGICIDIDECFINNYTCPTTTICRNGMGTYLCTCQRGYRWNLKTNICQRGEMMHRRARLLKYHPDMDSIEQDRDFIDDITEWLGLSGATATRRSSGIGWIVVAATVCVYLTFSL